LDVIVVVFVHADGDGIFFQHSGNPSHVSAADENFELDALLLNLEDGGEQVSPADFLELVQAVEDEKCGPNARENLAKYVPEKIVILCQSRVFGLRSVWEQ
jgi:hypothetical protein